MPHPTLTWLKADIKPWTQRAGDDLGKEKPVISIP